MKVILRSIILFILVPLTNSIGYGILTLFHDTTFSELSVEAYARYREVTLIMLVTLFASILVLEFIYTYTKVKDSLMSLLYGIVILFVALLSYDQFGFRPYEHTLTVLSISLILMYRTVLKKRVPSLFKRS